MKLSWLCLLLACYAAPASAQFNLQQSFEDITAPGWSFADYAVLTAPTIDPAGSGWLRLTAAAINEQGQALNTAVSFASNQPVVVEFSYVAWGGSGADGMTMFLYDASTSNPMSGAVVGGGLGYCGGAGGYLAVGLDEFGNFSNPADLCGTASGGPGLEPESMVIRGPLSANNLWVTTTSVPGGIDNPLAATRPSPKRVILSLTPASTGYTISAQFQSASSQPFQTLFSDVPFSYSAPANLSVGFSGSTGGSTNYHEIQSLVAATAADLQVTMMGPSSVVQGASVTYAVTVTNDGNYAISGGNAPTVVDSLPAALSGATWTCVGASGATCDASGIGNINTSNLTLPANASVTYTITGTLDSSSTCGSSLANSASADFGSSANFLDPDETNNSATVDSTVTCDVTLVASPPSLTFAPQTVNVASSSQAIVLTEGNNSSTISSIAVTGDYAETDNCPTSMPALQTCTINVVFTPTAQGSRSGTLTILSNATSSPTVTTVVTLSGTGTNTTPNAFSFTPLYDVNPSSVQVSNAITLANTNVPSPISVSSGAQYSINGGAFTSVPGVVSPGAQVQVQLTAASGYSTADSATLTVSGVSSTFTVTTGAQPVLQGGFTSVTGVAPSSVQTSNAITVTGITAAASVSISNGAEYSIDGGAFTSAAGVVQPGDHVRVQVTAPSTYNTTASAVLNIDGVGATYSVTTSAQAVLQGGFVQVTGAAPSSVQTSNPITVVGTTAAAPISISSGAEYSINGGPFTAAAATVQPGDQVEVQLSAASAYSTSDSAALTIGGVSATFTVTTGAMPVLQGTFAPVTGAAISSAKTSNAITVAGITAPAVISISSGAEYSINGGPFTSAAGTIQPGEQVRVQVNTASTYSTTTTATLNINGVQTLFSVTTGVQPLASVVVTGGGGALGGGTLLLLACIAVIRWMGLRRATLAAPILLAFLGGLCGSPVRADDGSWPSNVYEGLRLGGSSASLNSGKLTRELQADGYDVTSANAERASFSGTLYVGYDLPKGFGLELAGTYEGRTRASLAGVVPAQLEQVLADTTHIVRGSGDIVALEGRYRWSLAPQIAVDFRAGPYLWITRSKVYVDGGEALNRTDEGPGYTAGGGPRFALGQHFAIGLSADYFASTSDNHFVQYAATGEYHF